MTSTGDVVRQWKEYFEDLVNHTSVSSIEKAESVVYEVDSPIPGAEVAKVVQRLPSVRAPGVDEIRPEFLKALDVVGLSWLTRLCNIMWTSGKYLWIGRIGWSFPFL